MSHGFQQGFQNLPYDVITDKVAPGWAGKQDPRLTFEKWVDELNNWKNLKGYETDVQSISAVKLRVHRDVKEYMERMPAVPPAAAGGADPPVAPMGTGAATTCELRTCSSFLFMHSRERQQRIRRL